MAEKGPLRVIMLGATSAIAGAMARIYAEEGKAHLLLVARNGRHLAVMADDLRLRGATHVETEVCDLVDASEATGRLEAFAGRIGGADHVVIAHGMLGDQQAAETDWRAAEQILQVNFMSAAAWALAAAQLLERQGHGSLVVFGSVAGDRGRRNNFVYGAAKAGLAALMEGIAHRFAGKGPRAVLLKIGPTMTPMTAHMERKGPLWATPEQVARLAYARAQRGAAVSYAPRRWRYIMAVIRNLPAAIFNRLDI